MTKYQGIYSFGGIGMDNILNNNLLCLKTNTNELEWKLIETNGKKPCER